MFCAAGVVVCLAAAPVLMYMGDTRGAAGAVSIGLGAALVRVSVASYPSAFPAGSWLSLALLGIGLALLGFPVLIVAAGWLALFVVQLMANVSLVRRIRKFTVEPRPAGVMLGAEDLVRQFSAEGFRIIGAHCATGQAAIVTVMIGPGSDQLALVTDRVWEVISWFGGRPLVTINSGIAPMPPDVLRQQIAGGAPRQIVRAHGAALTLLERRALRPDVFTVEGDALEAVLALERRVLDVIATATLRTAVRIEMRIPYHTRPLADDPASQDRITAWLAAAPGATRPSTHQSR
jgi:hypothetical protein